MKTSSIYLSLSDISQSMKVGSCHHHCTKEQSMCTVPDSWAWDKLKAGFPWLRLQLELLLLVLLAHYCSGCWQGPITL